MHFNKPLHAARENAYHGVIPANVLSGLIEQFSCPLYVGVGLNDGPDLPLEGLVQEAGSKAELRDEDVLVERDGHAQPPLPERRLLARHGVPHLNLELHLRPVQVPHANGLDLLVQRTSGQAQPL